MGAARNVDRKADHMADDQGLAPKV